MIIIEAGAGLSSAHSSKSVIMRLYSTPVSTKGNNFSWKLIKHKLYNSREMGLTWKSMCIIDSGGRERKKVVIRGLFLVGIGSDRDRTSVAYFLQRPFYTWTDPTSIITFRNRAVIHVPQHQYFSCGVFRRGRVVLCPRLRYTWEFCVRRVYSLLSLTKELMIRLWNKRIWDI